MAKKKPLISNVTVGRRGEMDLGGLRNLARSNPETFVSRAQDLIAQGKFSWGQVRNLPGLFNALWDVEVRSYVNVAGSQRAVQSSAFPLLAGGLSVAQINQAYEEVPAVGDELVTDFEDNKKISSIAAIHSLDKDTDEVKEGDPFPEISAGEEKAEIRNRRNGRRLSITAETIEENDVADIVNRCNALGQIAGTWIEELTLDRVTDRYRSATSSATDPAVYRPDGSATALYSSTANTPGARAPSGNRVTNNPLVDLDSLESAREVLAAMLNNMGKRIAIPMSRCQLLVPDALAGVMFRILNSNLEPGVENQVNNWGPSGQYRPQPVSTPKLDDISTSAWYLGNFKEQFKRKWKLRFEYVTMSGDTQKFLDTRIAFQARIAWDMEVGATDYVYVVQNLSGTTY